MRWTAISQHGVMRWIWTAHTGQPARTGFVGQAPFQIHGAFIFAITIRFQSVASVSPLHTLSIGRSNQPQKVLWGPVLLQIRIFLEHQYAKWQNTYRNGLCLCGSRQSVEQQSNTVESSLTIPPARTPWTASNTLSVTICLELPDLSLGGSLVVHFQMMMIDTASHN